MPTLDFKGKQFIYAHHLTAPFRPLVPVAEKSLLPDGQPGGKGREPDMDGNLIIHGDNLHALKALLPRYAGRVNCIFIDPPYNTGNEGWCYNDNVRSPLMREWLKKSANPVDKEDLERHDKWLCMMWPRLQLLKDLLAEDGAIFVSIDDNEVHRLRTVMDEVFGEENFVACVIWQKKYSVKSDSKFLSESHEYLLLYAKSLADFGIRGADRTEEQNASYKNPDNDPRGPWTSGDLLRTEHRDYAYYEIVGPTGNSFFPPKGSSWRFNKDRLEELIADNRIWFGEDGTSRPRLKRFLAEVQDTIPFETLWRYDEVGSSDSAKKELARMFESTESPFATPKPVDLLSRFLCMSGNKDALILDSFAGSGTTAHAVLAQNKKDGGNRKFILVECEDYADQLTRERVRRVIQGYEFKGTQREELHREPITFTSLKKADKILERVAGYEMTDGHRFDRIKSEVKDGVLTVTGEKAVKERTEGLGGAFTYCELGPAVEIEGFLTGESLPAYAALASYVFYTATGQTLEKVPKARADGYIGETDLFRIHLHYQPDLDWLRSNESALNESLAEAVAKGNAQGKRCLVFATAKFMSQKDLSGMKIEFCQLPFAIHRLTGTAS